MWMCNIAILYVYAKYGGERSLVFPLSADQRALHALAKNYSPAPNISIQRALIHMLEGIPIDTANQSLSTNVIDLAFALNLTIRCKQT